EFRRVLFRSHLVNAGRAAGLRLLEAVFGLATLPHEAYFSLDAVLRTHARLLVTRRRLLEWNPYGDQARLSDATLADDFRAMWFSPAVALGAAAYLAAANPLTLAVAAPILVLWLASPAIAWWTSQPLVRPEPTLTEGQIGFLRRTARKTWAFFETFV